MKVILAHEIDKVDHVINLPCQQHITDRKVATDGNCFLYLYKRRFSFTITKEFLSLSIILCTPASMIPICIISSVRKTVSNI